MHLGDFFPIVPVKNIKQHELTHLKVNGSKLTPIQFMDKVPVSSVRFPEYTEDSLKTNSVTGIKEELIQQGGKLVFNVWPFYKKN
ncbi:hypothetical protein HanRHA438_Chr02g0065791 [Helianthus annuus]|nr:hypothetical protein HanRHA438_Chr02g0065791 [Helianthus annuus]